MPPPLSTEVNTTEGLTTTPRLLHIGTVGNRADVGVWIDCRVHIHVLDFESLDMILEFSRSSVDE